MNLYTIYINVLGGFMKLCNKCLETKSEEEFWKDTTKSDGLQSNCKDCKREMFYKRHLEVCERKELRSKKEKIKQFLKILKKIKRSKVPKSKENLDKFDGQHTITCSRCGTSDQNKFSVYKKRKLNKPYKKNKKNWCIDCFRLYDKERRAKAVFDPNKIITCPKCKRSGDFQSNLFHKHRYTLANKFCTCKSCRKTPADKVRKSQLKRLQNSLSSYFKGTARVNNIMKYVGCTPGDLVKYL